MDEALVKSNDIPIVASESNLVLKRVLIQTSDEKSASWHSAGRKLGVEIIRAQGSPICMPVRLLQSVISFRRPDAVLVRYLNDYASVVRTLVRASSEAVLYSLCWILRIKVLWLCHNIDRESLRAHPFISEFRRKMVQSVAAAVFVTDPQLVSAARATLSAKCPVLPMTFGPTKGTEMHEGDEFSQIRRFVAAHRRSHKIGYVAGTLNHKTLHFQTIVPLIEAANQRGVKLAFIVVVSNAEGGTLDNAAAVDDLRRHPQVLLFDRYVRIDDSQVSPLIDFHWRVYTDQSVPFTVYHAVTNLKPILTMPFGFLHQLVADCNLGAIVEPDFRDVEIAIDGIRPLTTATAEKFFAARNWELAVSNLGSVL